MRFDAQRLVAALLLAATALFLITQRLRGRRRRMAMVAAVAVYGVVFAGALVYAGLWLMGVAAVK